MEENITNDFMNTLLAVRKERRFFPCLCKLRYSEMAVLSAICFLSESTPQTEAVKTGDICAYLKISKPAASQILDHLEDKGVIRRIQLRTDRRSAFVHITEEGKKIFEKERLRLWEATNKMMEKMGEDDARKFVELLKKFHSILESMDWEESKS